MAEKGWHRPGLVGPALLILVGGALLLGNLGLLRADWWGLLRLWPAVLILVGLDMLARHSRWGSLLVAVLIIALLAGLFYVMVAGPGGAPSLFAAGAVGGERLTREVSQDLAGATEVDVNLRIGAGELRVTALEDSPRLLEGTLGYPDGWQPPSLSYQVTGGVGRLELASRRTPGWALPLGPAAGETWALALTREVPLNISVDAGASTSELDLRALSLKSLRVKAGVGRMEVYFPSEGAEMAARIDGGVGELVLHIPEGVAARVTVDGGLGSLSLSPRFRPSREHTFETAGYGTAESRLDLRVDGGVGSLRVE
jgi:hypothetical protein